MHRKIFLDHSIDNDDSMISDESLTNTTNENPDEEDSDTLLTYTDILNSTIKQFPEKLLFSVKETADALSVSVEFIRKKIAERKINPVSMGDRKMISINELAKLIYKGA